MSFCPVQYILDKDSRGIRASTAGQHGGGLSVCLTPPHNLSWEPYCGGDFRATVGKALWGEKWQRVLEGGTDADKIEEQAAVDQIVHATDAAILESGRYFL